MADGVIGRIKALKMMSVGELRDEWMRLYGEPTSSRNRDYLWRRLAWRVQELAHGGISDRAKARVQELDPDSLHPCVPTAGSPARQRPRCRHAPAPPKVGSGHPVAEPRHGHHENMARPRSAIAGPGRRLRAGRGPLRIAERGGAGRDGPALERPVVLRAHRAEAAEVAMALAQRNGSRSRTGVAVQVVPVRCAIYTRKSTDDGLDRAFTSLDNQRERAESYIASQADQGWRALPDRYDDGGFSGGTVERPALKRLIADVDAGLLDTVVVYRLDRLSRSLVDFGRIHELLEKRGVALVSVTESINTTTSHGRMMVNVLLSFAQYERELIGDRTRDKMHAARRRGQWTGGTPILGYDTAPEGGRLVVNKDEADQVRAIFDLFAGNPSLIGVATELNRRGWRRKSWTTKGGTRRDGGEWNRLNLRTLLTNPLYAGMQKLGDETFQGEHPAIISKSLFQRVQRCLDGNQRNHRVPEQNRHGALLRGLLRCSACDAPMMHAPTTKNGKLFRYYRCQTVMKKGAAACSTKPIVADAIETFVVERDQAHRGGPRAAAGHVRTGGRSGGGGTEGPQGRGEAPGTRPRRRPGRRGATRRHPVANYRRRRSCR